MRPIRACDIKRAHVGLLLPSQSNPRKINKKGCTRGCKGGATGTVENGAADYVNSLDAKGQKLIARAFDGRDLQIWIGGNPQGYAA